MDILIKKILNDRALKVALISVFGAKIFASFNDEMFDLLKGAAYSNLANYRQEERIDAIIKIADEFGFQNLNTNLRGLILNEN